MADHYFNEHIPSLFSAFACSPPWITRNCRRCTFGNLFFNLPAPDLKGGSKNGIKVTSCGPVMMVQIILQSKGRSGWILEVFNQLRRITCGDTVDLWLFEIFYFIFENWKTTIKTSKFCCSAVYGINLKRAKKTCIFIIPQVNLTQILMELRLASEVDFRVAPN